MFCADRAPVGGCHYPLSTFVWVLGYLQDRGVCLQIGTGSYCLLEKMCDKLVWPEPSGMVAEAASCTFDAGELNKP